MAELEVSLRYNSTPAKLSLFTTLLLLPIWGIIAPIVLGIGLFILITSGDRLTILHQLMNYQTTASILAILLLPFAGTFLTLAFADNRLIANRSGLRLPLFLSPFKRDIPWSKISSITVGHFNKQPVCLFISTASNKLVVPLQLHALQKSELEQLLLAVDAWGPNVIKSLDLIEMQDSLQKTDESEMSYTALWEEELARRYSSTAFVPLEPDHTLRNGELKIVRQLSFGGLSAIYLCQKNQKDLVVLKECVVPSGAKEEVAVKAVELFEREATLLSKLNHQNIVKVLDHFMYKSRNYMVLEYINGQDLRQLVKQSGPQSERIVLKWVQTVVSVLEHLHSQNPPILHRDLTPDNIVLRADKDELMIIDFGAANELIGNATGTLVGKQSYISPEQFRGDAEPASDFYSLGCTIFFLLTGEDPEALSTSDPREINNQISESTAQLVLGLTAMDTQDRPNATQIRQRLSATV